jgi:hypothetical protein
MQIGINQPEHVEGALIAQLAERTTEDREVTGSNPVEGMFWHFACSVRQLSQAATLQDYQRAHMHTRTRARTHTHTSYTDTQHAHNSPQRRLVEVRTHTHGGGRQRRRRRPRLARRGPYKRASWAIQAPLVGATPGPPPGARHAPRARYALAAQLAGRLGPRLPYPPRPCRSAPTCRCEQGGVGVISCAV